MTPPKDKPLEAFVMPILGTGDVYGRIPKETITFIPTAEDREWSKRNHGQTLERIRERGGFGWCELAAVFERRPWHKMPQDEAEAVCRSRSQTTEPGDTPHDHR
jgi:hypothetical protein